MSSVTRCPAVHSDQTPTDVEEYASSDQRQFKAVNSKTRTIDGYSRERREKRKSISDCSAVARRRHSLNPARRNDAQHENDGVRHTVPQLWGEMSGWPLLNPGAQIEIAGEHEGEHHALDRHVEDICQPRGVAAAKGYAG